MNLFDLHPKPETLKGYKQRFDVPVIAFKEARKIWGKKHKRVPELEHTLAKYPNYAIQYAKFIKQRFIEGEKLIMNDPDWANIYAREVIKGRWPEGEPAIARGPEMAYYYAHDVLHDRFPLGEPAIATSPSRSYFYAIYVIKGRFLLGEQTIAHHKDYKRAYENRFKIKLVYDRSLDKYVAKKS